MDLSHSDHIDLDYSFLKVSRQFKQAHGDSYRMWKIADGEAFQVKHRAYFHGQNH